MLINVAGKKGYLINVQQVLVCESVLAAVDELSTILPGDTAFSAYQRVSQNAYNTHILAQM
jgi:hypothetical protein